MRPAVLAALRFPRLGVPLACWMGEPEVEAALLRRGALAAEYYVYTSDDLARKLEDVLRCEHVVVPSLHRTPWRWDRGPRDLRILRRWSLRPVRLERRREDLDPDLELARLLAERYEPVEEVGPMVVLRRRAAAGARP